MTATLSESAAREQAGFLRAIVEQPADDAPRLVYADWLDEHGGTVPCPICHGPGFNRGGLGGPIGCTRCRGELVVSDGLRERAEFIRVQVAIAAQFDARGWGPRNRQPLNLDMFLDPQDADDQTWKHRMYALGERERELWRVLPREGLIPEGFAGHYGFTPDAPNVSVAIVSRGFVGEVRCSLETLFGGACGRCGGLKRGDQVRARAGYHLACGSGVYAHAVVVSLNPFALVSEPGDMLWTATQGPHTVERSGAYAAKPLHAFQRWDVAKKGYQKAGDGDACPDCKGTGRAEGVAKALFAAHPVTKIDVGARAIRSDRGPGFKCWSLVTHIDLTRMPELDGVWVWYETERDALDSLNARLVAHCRGLAGLPPLEG